MQIIHLYSGDNKNKHTVIVAMSVVYGKLVWRCNKLLSGFLANGHFPRVLCQSRPSVNDKGDEMISEAVLRSSGIYLSARETPRNLSL